MNISDITPLGMIDYNKQAGYVVHDMGFDIVTHAVSPNGDLYWGHYFPYSDDPADEKPRTTALIKAVSNYRDRIQNR